MNPVAESKKILRKEMLARRRNLSQAVIAAESKAIEQALEGWPLYQQANAIMIYVALADEPQTLLLIEQTLLRNKKICVPFIGEKAGIMEASLIESLTELAPGKYGILAPVKEKLRNIQPECIDLILVPGVAFTSHGQRLGMGAGYYDRFFDQAHNALKIGLAFKCQIIEEIPCEGHDHSIDYLATKDGIINCKTGKM